MKTAFVLVALLARALAQEGEAPAAAAPAANETEAMAQIVCPIRGPRAGVVGC